MPPEVVDEPSNQNIPSALRFAKCTKPYRLKYREKVRLELVQSLLAADEPITTATAVTSCVDNGRGCVVPVRPPSMHKDVTSSSSTIIQSSCDEMQMIPFSDNNEEHRPSKNHSHMTQGEYLRHKKQPQVIAVTRTLARMILSAHNDQSSNQQQQQQRPITILDVGGACGYLTIPLLTILPQLIGRDETDVRVVIVDLSLSALEKGGRMLESMGLMSRVTLIHANFFDMVDRSSRKRNLLNEKEGDAIMMMANATAVNPDHDSILEQVTHVTSLHSCGTLSDAALQFASHFSSTRGGDGGDDGGGDGGGDCDGAVVVPCCFAKTFGWQGAGWRNVLCQLCQNAAAAATTCCPHEHEHENDDIRHHEYNPQLLGDTLTRLAEMNDTRHVSEKGMECVNALRLRHLRQEQPQWSWWEEAMDPAWTAKNIMLCGARKQQL